MLLLGGGTSTARGALLQGCEIFPFWKQLLELRQLHCDNFTYSIK